jgi:hypothetical protein
MERVYPTRHPSWEIAPTCQAPETWTWQWLGVFDDDDLEELPIPGQQRNHLAGTTHAANGAEQD